MSLQARLLPLSQRAALSLLRAEHDMLLRLFGEYQDLHTRPVPDHGRKAVLAARICRELSIHAALEEQACYPAIEAAAGRAKLPHDARVGQQAQQRLVDQLRSLYTDDSCFDAPFAVLGEETPHHIAHEQSALFDCARSCGIDLQLLARERVERRRAPERGSGSRRPAADAFGWAPRLQE